MEDQQSERKPLVSTNKSDETKKKNRYSLDPALLFSRDTDLIELEEKPVARLQLHDFEKQDTVVVRQSGIPMQCGGDIKSIDVIVEE